MRSRFDVIRQQVYPRNSGKMRSSKTLCGLIAATLAVASLLTCSHLAGRKTL